MSGGAPRGSRSARPWLVTAALAAVVVVAVLAIGGRRGGVPLDPRSDDRLGTSALVALARELGADVAIGDRLPDLSDGPAGDAPDVVVLFVDLLDDEARRALDGWVGAGGRLIVTDPASLYAPVSVAGFDAIDELPRGLAGRCEIDALAGIDVVAIEPRNGGTLYDAGSRWRTCVDDGWGGSYIAAREQGEGTVVVVGGTGLVVNEALAEGENAPVVAALVSPRAGTDVLVLEPTAIAGGGGGGRTVGELVPSGVWRALAQLALAFALYALWRARRLGRPVPEPQPVAVAGSELVLAVGNLLDRSRRPAVAAELLRADLRRFLGDHLGLPPGSPPDVLAAVAADRTGADEAALRRALDTARVTDDDDLLALAHTIDDIRREVLAHA